MEYIWQCRPSSLGKGVIVGAEEWAVGTERGRERLQGWAGDSRLQQEHPAVLRAPRLATAVTLDAPGSCPWEDIKSSKSHPWLLHRGCGPSPRRAFVPPTPHSACHVCVCATEECLTAGPHYWASVHTDPDPKFSVKPRVFFFFQCLHRVLDAVHCRL